jgi:hypothetical protein
MATHPRATPLAPIPRIPLARPASPRPRERGRAPAGHELARGVVSRRALEEAAGVVRSRWRRVPRMLLLSLLLLGVGALGVYQVLQTSRIAEVGYELRTLEGERSLLAAEVRLLEARAAQLARVAELEQRSADELSMAEPVRTLQVAVGVPAPGTIPLPERFVPPVEELPEKPAPWWRQLLDRWP